MRVHKSSAEAECMAARYLLHVHNAGVLKDRANRRVVGRDSGIAVEVNRRKNLGAQEGGKHSAESAGLRQSCGTGITREVVDACDAVTSRHDQICGRHVGVAGDGIDGLIGGVPVNSWKPNGGGRIAGARIASEEAMLFTELMIDARVPLVAVGVRARLVDPIDAL